MMIPTGMGAYIADSPACPGGYLEPASGQCFQKGTDLGTGGDKVLTFTQFTQVPGAQIQDPYVTPDNGIDTAAGMVQAAVQNIPGVPDPGMIQTMVGAGAPGVPIQSGAQVQPANSGLSTWILPGIIGLVVVYVISKRGGR